MSALDYLLNFAKKTKEFIEAEYFTIGIWYIICFIIGLCNYYSTLFNPCVTPMLSLFLGIIYYKYSEYSFKALALIFLWLSLGYSYGLLYNFSYNHDTLENEYKNITLTAELTSIKPKTRITQLTLRPISFGSENYDELEQLRRARIDKLRINLKHNIADLFIGATIKINVNLMPPPKKPIAGGYDFAKHAFFNRISAVGYSLEPPQIVENANQSAIKLYFEKLRYSLYKKLISNLGRENGSFAAAIMIGETSAIEQKVIDNLRQAGISHILCVSGLHLSIVALIFFMTSRFLLNLFDRLSFYLNIKCCSAILAILGSMGYLLITGMQVAATRAFCMVMLVMLSVIIKRLTYPINLLAIAALTVLIISPYQVLTPSFQLSFSAVLSLISGYQYHLKSRTNNIKDNTNNYSILHKLKIYFLGNIYSSLLAGAATTPFVIYFFYINGNYSILANLIAIPITSLILLPCALLAIISMPIGYEKIFFKIMGYGINLIVYATEYIVNLPFSVWHFGYITPAAISLFIGGFLWVSIWQSKARILGLVPILLSFIMMYNTQKPIMIIDNESKSFAFRDQSGKLRLISYGLSPFKKKYWYSWFGQQEILDNNKQNMQFLTKIPYGLRLYQNQDNFIDIIYKEPKYCNKAKITIDFSNNLSAKCNGQIFNKQTLAQKGVTNIYFKKNRYMFEYSE